MRTNCFAIVALLLLPFLGGCGTSDLTVNVVYTCDRAANARTLMQVKVQSDSDQDIELRSVLETDGQAADEVKHPIKAKAAYNIVQVPLKANDTHTYVVHVYRDGGEIETATFGPDNRKCDDDDFMK